MCKKEELSAGSNLKSHVKAPTGLAIAAAFMPSACDPVKDHDKIYDLRLVGQTPPVSSPTRLLSRLPS